jgi:SNF family Na+-dependent transporter
MIFQLVRLALHNEVVEARRKAQAVVILAIAAVFLCIAVLFALMTLYLWLSTVVAPWQAAGIIALALLLIGLIFWIAGRSRLHRRVRSGARVRQAAAAAIGPAPASDGGGHAGLGAVAAAAAIGVIVGRILTR